MDEIDAALDYKNTTLLAQYITSKKATQHIVISLRKNMYQECNRVIGVYKIKDQSRIVEMNMSEIKQRENEWKWLALVYMINICLINEEFDILWLIKIFNARLRLYKQHNRKEILHKEKVNQRLSAHLQWQHLSITSPLV